MLSALLTSSISFCITLIAIPAIIRVADQKGLHDVPDARKVHTRAIASLGGVGMFMGVLLSMLLTVSGQQHPEFQYFYAAATIIFFLGMKDDILILSPFKKFLVQLATAAILIHLGGLRIDSMHGLLGITALPQAASLVLTYATMVVVINAFNLIDGVDGLAGSLGLMTMSIFGTYFTYIGLTHYALLAFAMAGSLIAFLYFNFNPAKIFMGDSGSLLLGMLNAILVIKFLQVADNPVDALPAGSSIALAIAVLMVPLADTLRVFGIRIVQGRSPFSPDRNHIHHLLLDRGMNHKQVTATCLVLNLFFIVVAYYGRGLGSMALILFMAALSVLFLSLLVYLKKPVKRLVPGKPYLPGTETVLVVPQTPSKVVAMNTEMAMVEN
jgi:UDP-GlcNAc:undecaprenyl-phosphate/decaprenyl-phosphate GlcNAc-1-phosphate transferase